MYTRDANGRIDHRPTICPLLPSCLRNGIDDVNFLHAAIFLADAKCEHSIRPNEATASVLQEAKKFFSDTVAYNSCMVKAIDDATYATTADAVVMHTPGVVYKTDANGKRAPITDFHLKHGPNNEHTLSGGLSFDATLSHVPYVNAQGNLVCYNATKGQNEVMLGDWSARSSDIIQTEDVAHLPLEQQTRLRGTYKYGSLFAQVRVGADGKSLLYDSIHPPSVNHRPWKSQAGEATLRGFLSSRLEKNGCTAFANENEYA